MSKTITGKQAVELLEKAEAVIILDGFYSLAYMQLESDDELTNVDCSYTDGGGLTHESSFKIWQDDEITVKDNYLLLPDSYNQGQVIWIKLLQEQQL